MKPLLIKKLRKYVCSRRILIALTSIIIVLSVTISMIYSTSNSLVVTRYSINLGRDCLNTTTIVIAQISDLHIRGYGELEKSIIRKLIEIKPDLIVLTGDYLGNPENGIHFEKFMSDIRKYFSNTPIIGVLGNGEYQLGTVDTVIKVFMKYNAMLLINDIVKLKIKNVDIEVIGFDDVLRGYPDIRLIDRIDRKALIIVLVHEPIYGLELAKHNISGIVFSGHCHGGQIKYLGVLFLPRGCRPTLYEGLHRVNNTYIVISRGIGTSIIPIRLGVNPELVVVELKVCSKTT